MSFHSGYGYDVQCCESKVDPISLLITIAAIAVVSAFLRQAVIDNNIVGVGRKKRNLDLDVRLGEFLRKKLRFSRKLICSTEVQLVSHIFPLTIH